MLEEWKHFKVDVVRGNIGIEKVKSDSFSEFWSFVSRHYRRRYPWLVMLLLIVRLLPIGSADCERMFSLMNRLKTDRRNRLTTEKLDVLMRVNRLAPSVAEVTNAILDEWIDHWDSECKAGRSTSYFE
jgi:hypothetical protein